MEVRKDNKMKER